MYLAQVEVINVGRSELIAWLGDYCTKQNFECGHRGGVGGRTSVKVDLVTDDCATHAVLQLAHLNFCSAVGIVVCCFAAAGNVFLSDPPTSLGMN